MDKTIFQKIFDGELPSDMIYKDDRIFAIMDIMPTNKGHVLVIPIHPYKDIYELNGEDGAALMKATALLARAVKKGVNADGVNIHINNESAAGQVVFHLHIHIIPRFEGDGHQIWGGRKYENAEEQTQFAQKIKDAI